jgi:glycerol-3-phosphate O-acyltransferase/dihydroxyacetone phosphate acyltransferase
MRIGLRIFFRKIYLVNMDAIPKKGPVILASTHPNSFTDDVFLGAFLKRPVIFLARGDVFKSKIGNFFLKAMHVYPIFRGKDNAGDVQKNLDSFSFYQNYLSKGGVILIHPEGISAIEKNVRPIKKGIGRIAFGAEDAANWNLGVQIVPISLNYTNAPYAREDIMVQVSEPIAASVYKDQYLENPNIANTALAKDLMQILTTNSIIQTKGTEEVCEKSLIMARNEIPHTNSVISTKNNRFNIEKQTSEKVNHLFTQETAIFTAFKQQIDSYFTQLNSHTISDKQIKNGRVKPIHLLLLGIKLIIAGLGYLIHFIPYKIAVMITEKVIQSTEFRASILLGLNWVFYLGIYLILFISAVLISDNWLFLYLIPLALLGMYGKNWKRLSKQFKHSWSFNKLLKFKTGVVEELIDKRSKIITFLDL